MYGRPVPHAPDQTSNHSATPEPHQQHPTSESTANNPPRTTEAHSAAPTTAQPGGHPVPADPAGAETDDSDNDREIRRKQLEKANTDPAWFKKYYQKNGHRIRKDRRDENNNRVPQLHPTGDPKTPWMLASDAPEAEGESYIDTGEKKGKRKVGISKENLEILDKSAKKRQNAIDADDLPHKARQQAKENYEKNKTAENKAEFDRADAIHSPLHGKMTRASEDYGEDVAEYHAVPEHFKDAVRVDDRGTGNNRFDQVWKLPNGEFIVVEAKGSPRASLGDRRGLPAGARDIDHEQPGEGAQQHNGTGQDSQEDSDNSTSPAVRRVKQGTREYFKVILHEMKTRSNENLLKATTDAERAHALAERKLANELTDALLADPSRITYLLVKGVPDGEKHGGTRCTSSTSGQKRRRSSRMIKIPRHEFPTRNVGLLLEVLNPDLQKEIDSLSRNSEWFTTTLASAVQVLNVRCADDPTAAKLETWESCVTAMQVGSALFASARANTESVECLIDHKRRTIPAGAQSWVDAATGSRPSGWPVCAGRRGA